jgi:thioredoxin 1
VPFVTEWIVSIAQLCRNRKKEFMKTAKKLSFNDLIKGQKKVLVDFHATWCGPCKMMTPILKELKSDIGDDVRIVKIDVDKNQGLAQKYQVRGVPTLMLFQAGKVLWRQSGVVSAPQLKDIIKAHGKS